jgi:MATE family multidrug resistance protein
MHSATVLGTKTEAQSSIPEIASLSDESASGGKPFLPPLEPPPYTECGREILRLSAPSMLSVGLNFSLSSILFAIVGHRLGTEAMAATSVGYFFLCIAALYPLNGIVFAVDTLCAQAYGRDKWSLVQGAVAQRSILVSTALMIPGAWLLQHTEQLLVPWYGAETGRLAADWLSFTPLYILPTLYCTTLAKFLCSQYLPHLPTIALTVAVLSTPISQGFFIQTYGFSGSAIGLGATAWLQFVTLALLTYFNADARRRFGSWSWKNVTAWAEYWTYIKLGVPSSIFVSAESGAFDVSALIAGQLGAANSAASAVMVSLVSLAASVCCGMSTGTCACVGSALGAGDPLRARRMAATGVGMAAILATIDALLIYRYHHGIFFLFTTDPKVIKVLSNLIWIIIPLHISDSIQFVFQGIFSGCGQNHLGAMVMLGALWGCGVGSIWMFVHHTQLGLLGVFEGLTIGLALSFPLLSFIAFTKFNWYLMARDASRAEECGKEPAHEDGGEPTPPMESTSLKAGPTTYYGGVASS